MLKAPLWLASPQQAFFLLIIEGYCFRAKILLSVSMTLSQAINRIENYRNTLKQRQYSISEIGITTP